LLAKRPAQPALMSQTHRYRWQASAYRGSGCKQALRVRSSTVGAGLPAMTSAQPALMSPDIKPSRASPLPQVRWLYAKSANGPNHCGSGLAREEAGTSSIDVTDTPLPWQASSYRGAGCKQALRVHSSTVGAGLPAMTSAQPALMSPDIKPSRASPLPQVRWLYAKSANGPNHCGSGLAREEAGTSSIDVADTSLSLASQLPQVRWLYAKSANCPNHCGSGLAREEAGTSSIDVADTSLSLASQLLQGSGCK
jgi:uncharacterized membrane protein